MQPMRAKFANSKDYPKLLGSFISPSGFPGVAGTYAKSVVTTLRARTDILWTIFTLRLDFLRYKTTGNIASISTTVHFDKSEGPGGKPDKIIRVSGNFVTDGFTQGARFTVAGSLACDGNYIIEQVTPTVLYLSSDTPLPINANNTLINQPEIEYTGEIVTLSTKEKLLVRGTDSGEFSNAEQDITMPTVSFSDTFASDDRLVIRAWAQHIFGNADAWCGVETEGANPCIVALT
jgi:hypothetical protein